MFPRVLVVGMSENEEKLARFIVRGVVQLVPGIVGGGV